MKWLRDHALCFVCISSSQAQTAEKNKEMAELLEQMKKRLSDLDKATEETRKKDQELSQLHGNVSCIWQCPLT